MTISQQRSAKPLPAGVLACCWTPASAAVQENILQQPAAKLLCVSGMVPVLRWHTLSRTPTPSTRAAARLAEALPSRLDLGPLLASASGERLSTALLRLGTLQERVCLAEPLPVSAAGSTAGVAGTDWSPSELRRGWQVTVLAPCQDRWDC